MVHAARCQARGVTGTAWGELAMQLGVCGARLRTGRRQSPQTRALIRPPHAPAPHPQPLGSRRAPRSPRRPAGARPPPPTAPSPPTAAQPRPARCLARSGGAGRISKGDGWMSATAVLLLASDGVMRPSQLFRKKGLRSPMRPPRARRKLRRGGAKNGTFANSNSVTRPYRSATAAWACAPSLGTQRTALPSPSLERRPLRIARARPRRRCTCPAAPWRPRAAAASSRQRRCLRRWAAAAARPAAPSRTLAAPQHRPVSALPAPRPPSIVAERSLARPRAGTPARRSTAAWPAVALGSPRAPARGRRRARRSPAICRSDRPHLRRLSVRHG
eukprot:scaffold61681_cov75-Phaeocystis_antarctica.AAC.2